MIDVLFLQPTTNNQRPFVASCYGRIQMTGEVGSFRYMAPEIVKHEPYNAKADIYSWSLLSWEIMAISKPYAGVTESTFIKVNILVRYVARL